MARLPAISRLVRLLTRKHQPPMSMSHLCEHLECSEKTVDRCIRELRDTYGYPIDYDREAGGFRLASTKDGETAWELPGLFFSESELTALVTMRHLLENVQAGLFERELAPLGRRVEKLLEQTGVSPAEVARRIRVLAIGTRRAGQQVFRICADAVLSRRRLLLEYQSRGREGDWETRELSPQRLVRYRDNWYLDAWCHSRQDVRVFALDQMRGARICAEAAVDVSEEDLDRLVKSSYGIFTGPATARAVLRFTARRAQWVSKEEWHGDQEARVLPDGSYELVVPYGQAEELLMDILKHGPEVEVMGPPELRVRVAELLEEGAGRYQ